MKVAQSSQHRPEMASDKLVSPQQVPFVHVCNAIAHITANRVHTVRHPRVFPMFSLHCQLCAQPALCETSTCVSHVFPEHGEQGGDGHFAVPLHREGRRVSHVNQPAVGRLII